jgi:RimJ/RimL family protein N-acetyltransferase
MITIRPAQETDALAYRALRLEALHNNPEAFSADYATNERRPMSFWEERLRAIGSNNMFYFALDNNDLVGTCGIYRGDSSKTQHSATIVGVYVQPKWRGFKIAEGLINGCIEWGQSHGVMIVKVGVVTTNTAAIRCYARCGFKVYGVEPQAIFTNDMMYGELLMARDTQ